MKTRLRLACACLAALAVFVGVTASMGMSTDTTTTSSGEQRQQLLDDWRERAGIPAVALAIDGPEPGRFVTTSGTTEREGHCPVSPEAQFRVASITKMFVATVVMQLVEDGRIGLDDRLTDYLPDAPLAQGVTIRQLLQHTSGIPDYGRVEGLMEDVIADRARRWSTDELFARVADYRRDFPPGTDYSYSNTGYLLLGEVVQVATGQTWAEEVHRRIINPLRLRHTFISGTERVPGGIIAGYMDLDEDGEAENVETGRPWRSLDSIERAAGAIVSTAGDLATFADALFRARLVKAPTLQLMVTEGSHRLRTAGYGLGVEVLRPDYRMTLWGHGGSTLGYRSVLLYAPAYDLVVVALANDGTAAPVDLAELVILAEAA